MNSPASSTPESLSARSPAARRCMACGRWFEAKRSHARCCSAGCRVTLSRLGGEAGVRARLHRPPQFWDAVATCRVRPIVASDCEAATDDGLPRVAAIELPAHDMRRLVALGGGVLTVVMVGDIVDPKQINGEGVAS
ncbi:MAG: hypothetical protein AAGG38_13535 [Planctomycetota bacterium]